MIVAAWTVIGPTGVTFAGVVHAVLLFWVVVTSGARTSPLTHRWFRVRGWEVTAYRVAGVGVYARILDVIGWNGVITRARAFDGTRAGLRVLDQHTRRSEAGHLSCLLVTVLLACAVAWSGEWRGVGWLVGLGIVLHLYPVMLQRMLRARIRGVLAPSPEADRR